MRKLFISCFLLTLVFAGTAAAEDRASRGYREALATQGIALDSVGDPLAFSPQMQKVARELAGSGSPLQKLRQLQSALFDEERFLFSYDFHGTLTGEQAFNQRRGNCVSFTNMFIALGRSLGIPVQAALPRYGKGARLEDELLLANSHVIATYRYYRGIAIFDFEHAHVLSPISVRRLADREMRAIYLSNIAVDALRADELSVAILRLEASVVLAPRFGEAWGNLGVACRRAGQIRRALEAYDQALRLDPGNATVSNNLAALFRSLGEEERARAAMDAADLASATPFVLIVHGDIELREGRIMAGLRMYRRAHRYNRRLPEPLIAMAHAYVLLDRREAALRALHRAMVLDPHRKEAAELIEALALDHDTREGFSAGMGGTSAESMV